MGYKEGTGLGKHSQGRVEIVEASKQKGKRGLGMRVKNFEASDVQWDEEKEEVSAFVSNLFHLVVTVCSCIVSHKLFDVVF